MNTTAATLAQTDAPAYLERDTYQGKYTLRSNKVRSDVFKASELAAMANGQVIVLWESAGRMRDGVQLFCRMRYLPQADGSLVGYDADGARKIIHPADRKIHIRTK